MLKVNSTYRFGAQVYFWLVALLIMAYTASGQSVGLVLSGGGVRGMAHIGVMKALEENGIPIDFVAGTSAGATQFSSAALVWGKLRCSKPLSTDRYMNSRMGTIKANRRRAIRGRTRAELRSALRRRERRTDFRTSKTSLWATAGFSSPEFALSDCICVFCDHSLQAAKLHYHKSANGRANQ